MKNMATRALSGAVYVALIIGCILGGNAWFFGLMALFILLSMNELQNLLIKRSPIGKTTRIYDIIMALAFITAIFVADAVHNDMGLWIVGVCILYLPIRIIIAVSDKGANPAKSMLFSLLTVCYLAWPLSLLYLAYIADSQHGAAVVLISFILIWVNDTGAYLSGITMGRHKMCERLSPKKTWEGFWGGFILCIAAGVVSAFVLGHTDTAQIAIWAGYAAAVSVVGTYGDLFESLIKRNLSVKDSGNLIPGHGGILDRIDSILTVAPLAALMSLII